MKGWYVYFLSNRNHRLYVGITTDPIRRLREHRSGKYDNAFTRRYNWDRIVYFEAVATRETAGKRERQIKRMLRAEKVALIETKNPEWRNVVPTSWEELLALE